ncbi:MAG: hypothetical protein RLZZ184_28 [Cyanobacteriota bacterium]|jgi:hypothetical protein
MVDFYTLVETNIVIPNNIVVETLPVVASPPINLKSELIKINYGNTDIYALLASWQQPRKEINNSTFTVTNMTFLGTTATVTTSQNHGYNTNDLILIKGANQSIYNNYYTITKINNNQFSFPFSGWTITPATGIITCTKIVNDSYTDRYSLQYKKAQDSEWSSPIETFELSARWDNVSLGDYYVRIAAITINNKVSAYVQSLLTKQAIADFSSKNYTIFTGEF